MSKKPQPIPDIPKPPPVPPANQLPHVPVSVRPPKQAPSVEGCRIKPGSAEEYRAALEPRIASPCPCCNGESVYVEPLRMVACRGCGLTIQADTGYKALERWNRRDGEFYGQLRERNRELEESTELLERRANRFDSELEEERGKAERRLEQIGSMLEERTDRPMTPIKLVRRSPEGALSYLSLKVLEHRKELQERAGQHQADVDLLLQLVAYYIGEAPFSGGLMRALEDNVRERFGIDLERKAKGVVNE